MESNFKYSAVELFRTVVNEFDLLLNNLHIPVSQRIDIIIGEKMKIIVLKGSPNINGSSNMLADNFIMGAE